MKVEYELTEENDGTQQVKWRDGEDMIYILIEPIEQWAVAQARIAAQEIVRCLEQSSVEHNPLGTVAHENPSIRVYIFMTNIDGIEP